LFFLFFSLQNLRPPLSTNCSPVLNHLIKKCWSANPAKRPEFSYIVSALEKYDECLKEGLPVLVHQELSIRSSLRDIFKGCVPTGSSIPVHAWMLSYQIRWLYMWSILVYVRYCNCKSVFFFEFPSLFVHDALYKRWYRNNQTRVTMCTL